MSELNNMRTSDFSFLAENEAFFYVDHNNCLCSTISGKVVAANREQVDILIEYFQKNKGKSSACALLVKRPPTVTVRDWGLFIREQLRACLKSGIIFLRRWLFYLLMKKVITSIFSYTLPLNTHG